PRPPRFPLSTKRSGFASRRTPLSSFASSQLGPMTARKTRHAATWLFRSATKSTPAGMLSTSMKRFSSPNASASRSRSRPAVPIESSRRAIMKKFFAIRLPGPERHQILRQDRLKHYELVHLGQLRRKGKSTRAYFVEAPNHLSGTLTVRNGTEVANLTLLGVYAENLVRLI